MRIKSLELRDFQCHKSLVLDLNAPVVCIKGPTDSGKSAILRALRWVCQNNFAGDDFIREGAKKAEVVLNVVQSKQPYKITR
ncbi:MAG: AAA family ATPase, partial [Patescibacteria group bacterium]|nr:AAA family ATPase [Patescibacteria group bacterium]